MKSHSLSCLSHPGWPWGWELPKATPSVPGLVRAQWGSLQRPPTRLRGECGVQAGKGQEGEPGSLEKQASPSSGNNLACSSHFTEGIRGLDTRDLLKITQPWDKTRPPALPSWASPGHTCLLICTEPGTLGDVGLMG